MLRTLGIGSTIFFAVVMQTFALTGAIADAQPPEGVNEVTVHCPNEVSGVAAAESGFVVVGDGEPRYVFEFPTNNKRQIAFGNKAGNICDPEAIDVGYKPDGTAVVFILGEDSKTIFVEDGTPIVLPPEFYERCNRGAEGLSVKWSDGGWNLVALSEGGIPNKKHVPNQAKKLNCKKVKAAKCPLEKAIYNPVLAYYRVSQDGKIAELKAMSILRTSHLLAEVAPSQAFRATDVTWFEEGLLVLLGSGPISRKAKDGFRHTWIKGFKLDGTPIDNMTIKLEELWGDYREGKNWEGLDTTLDGRNLILSYDSESTPSELVIFQPNFQND